MNWICVIEGTDSSGISSCMKPQKEPNIHPLLHNDIAWKSPEMRYHWLRSYTRKRKLSLGYPERNPFQAIAIMWLFQNVHMPNVHNVLDTSICDHCVGDAQKELCYSHAYAFNCDVWSWTHTYWNLEPWRQAYASHRSNDWLAYACLWRAHVLLLGALFRIEFNARELYCKFSLKKTTNCPL